LVLRPGLQKKSIIDDGGTPTMAVLPSISDSGDEESLKDEDNEAQAGQAVKLPMADM
jgi:hypothetical protein